MQKIDQIFSEMWTDYCQLSPAAQRIHQLLEERGEKVLNDHVALRTFRHKKIGIEVLARGFESLGYRAAGEYFFKEKKLYAKHWEHPDAFRPKVFISELEVEKFSSETQRKIDSLIEQIAWSEPPENVAQCGRPWQVSHADYESLASVSEYAGWMAAFGFRPNHFTVFVNALKTFKGLPELNDFLQENGYRLNSSGGLIKGTPEECLEQSSTLAEKISVSFSDGTYSIPSVYYEFAKRYPQKDGKLYQGFIAQSADKIFESTDRAR